MAEGTVRQHWPAFLLGLLVALVFLAALVTFQVDETELAIVVRFGKPKMTLKDGKKQVEVYDPGLHWKWPYPIDRVWRHDNRLQCYELKRGQVEQIQTADNYQVVVTTFVLWRIGDPLRFMTSVRTTEEAERKLDEVVRNSRNAVIGRHKLTEMINTDPSKLRLDEIESEILEGVQPTALNEYGIKVTYIGLKHLGFPEAVTAKVFERMRAERKRQSEKYRAEGRRDARRIRADADLKASQIITDAESQAKRIRAEGDQTAAAYYAVFAEDPGLAMFLRKLDALRAIMQKKTTLVIDTRTPPFDLLTEDALKAVHEKTVFGADSSGAQAPAATSGDSK